MNGRRQFAAWLYKHFLCLCMAVLNPELVWWDKGNALKKSQASVPISIFCSMAIMKITLGNNAQPVQMKGEANEGIGSKGKTSSEVFGMI